MAERGRAVRRARETGTPALVGVVTRPKDWRLLVEQHWYRIPVATAPAMLPDARWFAFYQTKVFGAEKWAVNYCAPVLGITRARRVELLPDEPGHRSAGLEYFRVAVGELARLPHPIPSRSMRRIVFIPTTRERLLSAREINDLFCGSPIEETLYEAMRDDGFDVEREFFVREEGAGYMLDMAVFLRDGTLAVECDGEQYHSGREKAQDDRNRDNALNAAGWHVLRFSGAEILQDPQKCMEVIRRAARRLGWTTRRRR